jgi:hypothetical protein
VVNNNRPVAVRIAVSIDDDRLISFHIRAALFNDGLIAVATAVDVYASWTNPDSHFISCRGQQ